jgi:tRNA wybutosine-synthesizing protein 3
MSTPRTAPERTNARNDINTHADNDLYTTSSCSGRITLFAETTRGKKGGDWLLIEHGEVTFEQMQQALRGIEDTTTADDTATGDDGGGGGGGGGGNDEKDTHTVADTTAKKGLVTFRYEPFILSIEARHLESASRFLALAQSCGFRESGITAMSKVRFAPFGFCCLFICKFTHTQHSRSIIIILFLVCTPYSA